LQVEQALLNRIEVLFGFLDKKAHDLLLFCRLHNLISHNPSGVSN
jgi:hypothetical protein